MSVSCIFYEVITIIISKVSVIILEVVNTISHPFSELFVSKKSISIS